MMILQFDHISLFVSDLQKSKEFYAQVLELKEIPRPAFDFAGAWFQLAPGVQLHLIAGRDKPVVETGSRKNHFSVMIKDIFVAEQKAKDFGLNYVGPKKRQDNAWQLFIADPDGHYIEFSTPLA